MTAWDLFQSRSAGQKHKASWLHWDEDSAEGFPEIQFDMTGQGIQTNPVLEVWIQKGLYSYNHIHIQGLEIPMHAKRKVHMTQSWEGIAGTSHHDLQKLPIPDKSTQELFHH